jgi:uncharacterized membrane protein
VDNRQPNNNVAKVVYKNIQDLYDHRQQHEQKLTWSERLANRIAQYTGTTTFLYLNAAFFIVWIAINMGAFGIKPFDPFPFGMLTTVVSLEAIFLSLFVLLSQNRMQKLTDQQNELDLQVNLLAEHELTRLLIAVDLISKKLGVELPCEPELKELETDVKAKDLLNEIERNSED